MPHESGFISEAQIQFKRHRDVIRGLRASAPSSHRPSRRRRGPAWLFSGAIGHQLVVGSGNLTEGGLYGNYELGVSIEVTQKEHADLIAQVGQTLSEWTDPPREGFSPSPKKGTTRSLHCRLPTSKFRQVKHQRKPPVPHNRPRWNNLVIFVPLKPHLPVGAINARSTTPNDKGKPPRLPKTRKRAQKLAQAARPGHGGFFNGQLIR